MPFSNAIVLTGGIATGKSTVANLLKLHGFSIIDADKIAHKVLDQNANKIAELFGESFVEDGSVDRKALGKLIFSDKDAKKRLEALLHPQIREEIKAQAKLFEEKGLPYIVDIPLFFETKGYEIDEVLVVYATPAMQKMRLIEREGYSEDEADSRINAQLPIDEKRDLASFVIDNTKDLRHLQREVERFLEYIRGKYVGIKI